MGGHIKRAESLINKNFPEMLDDDHLLHFYLQTLHLVELIRAKNFTEAIKFAQEDIVEKCDHPECLPDLERAMGLLAYEKPEESPFGDLLKQGFRLKVFSIFHQNSTKKLRFGRRSINQFTRTSRKTLQIDSGTAKNIETCFIWGNFLPMG